MLHRLFFPGQLSIRQTASNNLLHADGEAIHVIHFSVVKAERLFVNVAEQVKRFYRNVCTLQTALQKAPEVLKAVCVDITVHVSFGVVDELMNVFGPQSEVRLGFIGEPFVPISVRHFQRLRIESRARKK